MNLAHLSVQQLNNRVDICMRVIKNPCGISSGSWDAAMRIFWKLRDELESRGE